MDKNGPCNQPQLVWTSEMELSLCLLDISQKRDESICYHQFGWNFNTLHYIDEKLPVPKGCSKDVSLDIVLIFGNRKRSLAITITVATTS